MEFRPYPSKHWSSDLILRNIGILMLSLQTLELCPYPCIPWNSSCVLWNIITFIFFSKHRNSGLCCYKFRISSSYPSKHWSSPLSLRTLKFWSYFLNIAISTLTFQTLTFWPFPSKDYNSGTIPWSIGILILFFQTLEFWPYPSNHWNSYLVVANIGTLPLSLQTLQFWPYLSKHCNLHFTLSLQTLEFWSYSSIHCNSSLHWSLSSYSSKHETSDIILQNIGILMLSLQTLELCLCPCMPWNSSRVLWKIIIFISFSTHKNSALFF